MFKLESYLTPWLLSYLDKYVKLKPEDFKLSLWGGDVVFRKLDLRLNVIEELTNIPITFKSGLIHELRIHIPWTRITSEPVVVTINTLEFVAKLKEQDNGSFNKTNTSSINNSTNNINKSTSSSNLGQLSEEQPLQQQQQQPLPTGYIQNLINKILANICIIVNNVIVKFVEDNIVLSFNMKSAECFSVNNQWEKAFVEINSQNIDLKKILQLNDCTICLDKLDNKKNSKVNYYQDPLIYRFSIQSRLDFSYNLSPPLSNTTNQITFEPQINLIKLNFYCRKFDASISDQQLPMIIRLVELIMAIVDDTLVLPECENNNDDNKSSVTESVNTSMLISIEETNNMMTNDPPRLDDLNLELDKQNTEDAQSTADQEQSWISWAWSYVPSVTNIIDDETTESLTNSNNLSQNNTIYNNNVSNTNNNIQIMIGVYIDELNVSFKLIEHSNHNQQQPSSSSSSSSRSYYFSQFLLANAKGIAVEINKKKDFLHLISGISNMELKSVGECCCKLCPKPSSNEIVFLKAGCEDLEEKTFHYLSDSLFDIDEHEINDQNIIKDIIIKDIPSARDQHGNLDESYGTKRFGAFYMDIFNKIENTTTGLDSSDLNSSQFMSSNDIYSQSFIFYGLELNISANFFHRLFKLIDRAQSNSYSRPYSSYYLNQQSTLNTSKLDSSFNELNLNNEINSKINIESLAKKLEKHIPLINTTFTLKDPSIKFYPYSHFLISTSQDINYESYLLFNVKYVYFNISRPVDEKSLFDVVSKLTNPSKKLIYDSYIHHQIIIDTLKVNLTIIDQQLFANNNQRKNLKQHEFTLLEPCYLELHFSNVIMQPDMWSNQYFPLNEIIVELPVLKLNIHKQTIFILNDYFDNYLIPILNQNVFNQIKKPNITKDQMKQAKLRQIIYKRLLEDFLQQSKFKRTEMIQICLNDLKFRYSITKIMQVIQLNCNMLNCYFLKDEKRQDQLIQLFESSNKINENNKSVNKDFLVLRAQLPLSIDTNNSYIPDPLFIYANVSQISINLRDELIYWLSYKPTRGDDELVNLLIMELFDDSITDPEMNENLNNFKIANQTIGSQKSDKLIESSISSALYKHKTITTTTKSIKSVSVSSR
jgi:vacuolar protein sorting-associated protein 13B